MQINETETSSNLTSMFSMAGNPVCLVPYKNKAISHSCLSTEYDLSFPVFVFASEVLERVEYQEFEYAQWNGIFALGVGTL